MRQFILLHMGKLRPRRGLWLICDTARPPKTSQADLGLSSDATIYFLSDAGHVDASLFFGGGWISMFPSVNGDHGTFTTGIL